MFLELQPKIKNCLPYPTPAALPCPALFFWDMGFRTWTDRQTDIVTLIYKIIAITTNEINL
jgi:hypothetical protein